MRVYINIQILRSCNPRDGACIKGERNRQEGYFEKWEAPDAPFEVVKYTAFSFDRNMRFSGYFIT